MMFSIIVVCLNPGEKLNQTLDSILTQTCKDLEIIVKDGKSTDGSIEHMRQADNIHLYVEKDRSIYDAMNQAVAYAAGEFVVFLNCGDLFYDETVLARTQIEIERLRQTGAPMDKQVLYGDTYGRKHDVLITSPPKVDGFTCYRNIPCHQSCIYATALCRQKPYDLSYPIRADYDHFLWCYYRGEAQIRPMGFTVSSYEGEGFSESKENQKRDAEEHNQITAQYMTGAELARYRFLLLLTLAPLRKWMADSKIFAGIYHWLKERVYQLYQKKR